MHTTSILPQSFFNRSTLTVTKELLGKALVRTVGNKTRVLTISEVEAYDGQRDKASHAHRGITERNRIMFEEGGRWYIYLVYGMHWMLNVTTEKKGYPAAILLRGGYAHDHAFIDGPGKLTKYLSIDKSLNGLQIKKSSTLWIEDRGINIRPSQITKKKRIGVDYAGEWADKLFNFSIVIK